MERVALRSGAAGVARLLMAVGLLLVWCSYSAAQDYSEPTASGRLRRAGDPLHETDIPALPGTKIHRAATASPEEGEAAPPARAPVESASQAGNPGSGLTYTVRPGDSLSAIADLYGLDVSDLARANHKSEDAFLEVGETLKIPNPFAAQVRRLEAKLQQLSVSFDAARHSGDAGQAKIQALTDEVAQLRASNQELEHGVRSLPWWRGLALTAGAAALLMLGVTALTMLEWLMLRRKFYELVEMNEAIRRLDQKYRATLAKAELRLQQLYGRRRLAAEDHDKSKLSPEEIEIDRLNQQLKDLLQRHLRRLGLPAEKARRRSRLRELLGGESLVEERVSRR